MNRRECGTTATAAATPPRMTPAQGALVQVSSRQNTAVRVVRARSSVRHRQAMPAGVRLNFTNRSSSWYGLLRWLRLAVFGMTVSPAPWDELPDGLLAVSHHDQGRGRDGGQMRGDRAGCPGPGPRD